MRVSASATHDFFHNLQSILAVVTLTGGALSGRRFGGLHAIGASEAREHQRCLRSLVGRVRWADGQVEGCRALLVAESGTALRDEHEAACSAGILSASKRTSAQRQLGKGTRGRGRLAFGLTCLVAARRVWKQAVSTESE